jgi:hypothetical protein
MSTYTDIRYDYNLPSGFGGSLNLISEQTASSSASLSFTGIDSTYRTYLFKFINMHPSTDLAEFEFNFSTDNGSSYNVTKTTTFIRVYHFETDQTTLAYDSGQHLAQSTSYQKLNLDVGNNSDEACSGDFYLFNPSSTTYVKHFISTVNGRDGYNVSDKKHVAGYGNTTSAINAIDFRFTPSNIDSGTIKMYGIA